MTCYTDFLKYEEFITMEEAVDAGNNLHAIYDFHILIKNKKIVLIYHEEWIQCGFCKMKSDGMFIFL